jgi:hypothetical protein
MTLRSMAANLRWLEHSARVTAVSDEELLSMWNSIKVYEPTAIYDGEMTMDDWAELLYSELSLRNMSNKVMA